MTREKALEKCVACQFYDRNAVQAEDKGVRWGQCRRTGPIVHPLSAKTYMVEGIWPHVRDDDWCGEWAAAKRSVESASTDQRSLLMAAGTGPGVRPNGRPGSLMTPLATSSDAAPDPAQNVRFGSD
jgi:hypothetical protein